MIQELFLFFERYYANIALFLKFAAAVDGVGARGPCATGALLGATEAVRYAWWRLVIVRGGRRARPGQDGALWVRLRELCYPAW